MYGRGASGAHDEGFAAEVDVLEGAESSTELVRDHAERGGKVRAFLRISTGQGVSRCSVSFEEGREGSLAFATAGVRAEGGVTHP